MSSRSFIDGWALGDSRNTELKSFVVQVESCLAETEIAGCSIEFVLARSALASSVESVDLDWTRSGTW